MSSDNHNKDITQREVSFKEILFIIKDWCCFLLSKWMIITLMGFVCAAFGFLYAFYTKPVYTATTTFVLEEGNSGAGPFGSIGGLASIAGIDLGSGGGIFQGDNILELYKSRAMIERTLLTEALIAGKKQLLINRYIEFNKLRDQWMTKPELKNIQFSSFENRITPVHNSNRLQDSIIGTIASDISKNYLSVTKPDKKASIINASVKSQDELFAKIFNDQIVRNVNDFYVQTKTKKSLENISILQQKTDSVRAVMNGAIFTAAAVNDATPNLNPTRQTQKIAPIKRSEFNAETNKALLTELVKNLELSKISLRKETPLIQVIDNPVFPLEKTRLGKLKGLLMGGIAGAFITCIILISRKILAGILA